MILDAGSGLRPLGHELMAGSRRRDLGRHPALATRTGITFRACPFFKPLSAPGQLVLHLRRRAGGRRAGGDPAPADGPDGVSGSAPRPRRGDPGARRSPRATWSLPDFVVRAFRLRHPGTTLGYRLAPAAGRPRHRLPHRQRAGRRRTVPGGARTGARGWSNSSRGTDTLIHDAMYAEQIIQARCGWGHSTPRQAVALAAGGGMSPADPLPPRAGARRRRARPAARRHPAATRPRTAGGPRGGGRSGGHGASAVRRRAPISLSRAPQSAQPTRGGSAERRRSTGPLT